MTAISKSILMFALVLHLGMGAHKFYVSVTQVEYYAPDRALQITSRVFIDDLDKALYERYENALLLGTENEAGNANSFIERYLNSKFEVSLNGVSAEFNFLGKKVDDDLLVLFLEVPEVDLSTLKSVEIRNEILMDTFEEQKNILHFKFGDLKKSFVLIRESPSGMLNF